MARERNGTLLERNGKLYVSFRFRDENGKQRDLRHVAESDARKKLKELLKDSESLLAKQLDSANMTFHELADYYIKNYLHKAIYIGDKKVSGVHGVTERFVRNQTFTGSILAIAN
jgi:hypothetical protein